jgi:hypothetical protein
MKIYQKVEVHPPEHVDLDKLTGVPPRSLILKIAAPMPLLYEFDHQQDLADIIMDSRLFEIQVWYCTEWVRMRRVKDREEGFRRIFRWTTFKPRLDTFKGSVVMKLEDLSTYPDMEYSDNDYHGDSMANQNPDTRKALMDPDNRHHSVHNMDDISDVGSSK